MRIQKRYIAVLLLAFAVTSVQAQRGCFHSPEAPTAALMLIGGVGLSLGSSLLARLGKRRVIPRKRSL